MAAQRVQGYLEKHRIGALFEDLMAKVIRDTPDEPIPYLIKTLKKIHTDQESKSQGWGSSSRPPSGKSPSFSRSIGLTGTSISRQSLEDDSSRQNHLAKSWAGSSGHAHPGSTSKPSREYSRPWVSGSKPVRHKTDVGGEENSRPRHGTKNSERRAWNSSTIVPTHDFDELFSANQRTKAGGERSRSHKDTLGSSGWGEDSRDMYQDLRSSAGRSPAALLARGTGTRGASQTYDELEEDLDVGRFDEVPGELSDANSMSSGYSSYKSRRAKPRHAAEEHRRQLQALLAGTDSTDRRGNTGSYVREKAEWEDNSTELLENPDDLESEGVSGVRRSGARVSKTYKPAGAGTESFRVSICARCAKIISDEQSDRKSEVGSIFSVEADESDNFDSASQFGSERGYARPTWPAGFDSESERSPRKGRHMYEAPPHSLEKGRHMYRGSFSTRDFHPSRPMSASSENSDYIPSKERAGRYQAGYSSDNETEASFAAFDRSSPNELGSRPWNRQPVESASEAGSAGWGGRAEISRGASRGFSRYDRSDNGDSDY